MRRLMVRFLRLERLPMLNWSARRLSLLLLHFRATTARRPRLLRTQPQLQLNRFALACKFSTEGSLQKLLGLKSGFFGVSLVVFNVKEEQVMTDAVEIAELPEQEQSARLAGKPLDYFKGLKHCPDVVARPIYEVSL